MVPIGFDCPGNREPITLSKPEILELKSPTGLFCNHILFFFFFFWPSVKGQVKNCYPVVKCNLHSELPKTFVSPLFLCIMQIIYAYAMLLCSLGGDSYHGLIELKNERERG